MQKDSTYGKAEIHGSSDEHMNTENSENSQNVANQADYIRLALIARDCQVPEDGLFSRQIVIPPIKVSELNRPESPEPEIRSFEAPEHMLDPPSSEEEEEIQFEVIEVRPYQSSEEEEVEEQDPLEFDPLYFAEAA